MPENKHLRFFLTLLYIALAILMLWFIFKFAIGILAPFIIAFIVSKIISYPVNFLENKLKCPRPLASGLFTILFYGIIGFVLYWLALLFFRELVIIFEEISKMDFQSTMSYLNKSFVKILSHLPVNYRDFIYSNIEGWLSDVISALKDFIAPIIAYATDIATSLPSILIFTVATIVSTYFFSCDYDSIKKKLANLTPMKWRMRYTQTRKQITSTFTHYLRALLILICITFVELSVGLMILRVPHPILIALTIALIDALPILGSGWVLMPWAIFCLFTHNYTLAIGLAVLYGVITIVRNILEPKIVGTHIGLHPLATLFSMYVGLKLFGIIGMFMPIPIALIRQFWEWGYFDFLKSPAKTE